jgi:hypothetical protein
MRLCKTPFGRACPSDAGITFHRVHGAERTDGSHGSGWRVEVRRQRGQRRRLVASHVARTLDQATAWARELWRPDWLWQLVDGLPEKHEVRDVCAAAILTGKPDCFLVCLDGLEEVGLPVDRLLLECLAEIDQVVRQPFP